MTNSLNTNHLFGPNLPVFKWCKKLQLSREGRGDRTRGITSMLLTKFPVASGEQVMVHYPLLLTQKQRKPSSLRAHAHGVSTKFHR